jgi:hypothetical protein
MFLSGGLLFALLVTSGPIAGCVSTRHLAVDLEGGPVDPFTETNIAATVLIFVSNDCPIANRYAPEIRHLQNAFADRGVRFWLVHADPLEASSDIREHARQYGLTMRLLRDPEHHLVKLAHAEVTPSAAVFTAGRVLVYHGRIDDRVVDLGKERQEPLHHDLAEALDDVLAGRAVRSPATEAIGCYIPARH